MSTNDKKPTASGSVLDSYINQSEETADTDANITECYTEMPTHVAMLDLVDAAGNCTALPYHALEEAKFNPSEGITLKFHGQEVKLRGRHFKPIYEGIIYQRISRIKAMHRTSFITTDQTLVTDILVSKK